MGFKAVVKFVMTPAQDSGKNEIKRSIEKLIGSGGGKMQKKTTENAGSHGQDVGRRNY